MVAGNYFEHTRPKGPTLVNRINSAGYRWRSVGENIAGGQPDIDTVIRGWLESDPHCANLLNPAFREVGLACARGSAANRYRTYWTLDFGSRQ